VVGEEVEEDHGRYEVKVWVHDLEGLEREV
jgi:hypothetical protein